MRSNYALSFTLISFCLFALCACNQTTPHSAASPGNIARLRVDSRVELATDAYRELITAPDSAIPEKLLNQARCVAVFPGIMKAAFIAGGRYGKGVATCRDQGGAWSPLTFLSLSGGSVGWQIGAEATDLVLLFTGPEAEKALTKSNITLGADLKVAAGPVGRSAEGKTDFTSTGIFAYARSEGLFAGASMEGSILQPDYEANENYYGNMLSPQVLLFGQNTQYYPEQSKTLLALLP